LRCSRLAERPDKMVPQRYRAGGGGEERGEKVNRAGSTVGDAVRPGFCWHRTRRKQGKESQATGSSLSHSLDLGQGPLMNRRSVGSFQAGRGNRGEIPTPSLRSGVLLDGI